MRVIFGLGPCEEPPSWCADRRPSTTHSTHLVGVVYEEHAGDAQQNSIQLGRGGVLR
jgi:hypothetical protein